MTIQQYNDIFKNPVTKSMSITSSGGITITNTNICMEQMSLEESLCSENSLVFGACESGCFKIRIADMNHNFQGELLTVNQIIPIDQDTDETIPYGVFKVISDKPTNDRRWRDLTCYDAMYDILNAEVIEWYNGLTFPMTMKNFRDSFFTYLGITQETTTLVNDSFMIQGGFSNEGSLSGKTIITSICELNGVFGHISRQGQFEYISLPSADSLTLDWYMDGTGAYEDYTVQKITGITAKSSEEDVGTTVGTDTNVYIVQDNPLIYGSEGTQGLTTALTNLLNNVKDITYRPFNVNTYGNPMLPLGTNLTISTRNQTINSFLMSRVLFGIQSLKDSISADGEQYVPSQVNSLRTETKRTKGKIHELINNVDELRSTIYDEGTGLISEIQQLSDEIVLKVDANGNIVKVELSANPSTGSTFAVNADNISFTSGSVLRFNANNIVIDSTYFKVNQYGNLTSTSGTIGGWEIYSTGLSYGMESPSDYLHTGAFLDSDGSIIFNNVGNDNHTILNDEGLKVYKTSASSGELGSFTSNYGFVVPSGFSTRSFTGTAIVLGCSEDNTSTILNTELRLSPMEMTLAGASDIGYANKGISHFYGIYDDSWTNNTVPIISGAVHRQLVSSSVTSTELGYLSGVTSDIQTQLNGKQATITGGATTITSSNLTTSRALVSNSSGKVAVSNVTDTELGYLSGATSNIQGQIDGLGAKSVSGNPVVITDAEAMNANSVVATITPTQTGSGTPSPTNARPFVGYSNVMIDRCGKNLLDPSKIKRTVHGTENANGKWVWWNQNIQYDSSLNYVLNCHVPFDRIYVMTIYEFDAGLNQIYQKDYNNVYLNQAQITVTKSETKYFRIAFYNNTDISSYDFSGAQLEIGTSPTAYEPFTENTYTVQLGDTYYQGQIDITGGKIVCNYASVLINDLNCVRNGYSNRFWIQSSDLSNVIVKATSNTDVVDMYCEIYKKEAYGNIWGGVTGIGVTETGDIWMSCPSNITTAQDFKTQYGSYRILYPFATPIEIQLTPTQIELLENNNTITTNVTSLNLVYQANSTVGDTTKALDKRMTRLEDNAHIYGVEWDGSSTTKWKRTDASMFFNEPHPAINNGNGYSPFDNIYPWAGMVRIEDADAGTLVSIPKFWYKWTRNGAKMKLQIADAPLEGFHVSPAHADRGDGSGERDVVYVGAYHCVSTYKSTTGVAPKRSETRASFRTNIHNLGSDIWQWDYAMLWTIRMLYLVEYADWNSQEKIGYGCGNNTAPQSNGFTDSMIYHTGTNMATKQTYGHTRYRYIEDLWGNVYDWCDGIYFSGTTIYAIKDPSSFSDSSGGTNIGTRPTSNGIIKTWTNPSVPGLEYFLYPASTQTDSTYSTYSCDDCYYDSSGVVLHVGANYGQTKYCGLFDAFGLQSASASTGYIGSRLMVLP